ncbi:MAG: nicotinate phosphoribosyltransferase [Nanoarchaeota archaeon]|nr:nicotinate phosphoribosyltransferase [Nanoarchaeota archaeon]
MKASETKLNLTMLTDLYQLTMDAVYNNEGREEETTTFDWFIRKLPKDRGYFIVAGLEDIVDYIQNLRFEEDDLEYLREQGIFLESELDYLRNFKFEGDIYAMPEGSVAFGNEPLLRVTAPRGQAQFIESFILNQLNHQTMIATKASRVVEAAQGRAVFDFGLRRAHGVDAAMVGARSSYIAGAIGTSNVLAGKVLGIPIKGTHAHSFIQGYDTELEAFRAYARRYPDSATLLIDTYDVMEGAKNAAIVAKELEEKGHKLFAVRLDSGDLTGDSIEVREYFDSVGLDYVKIVASNDLNEYKIEEMIAGGARIDAFGVGTEMITSKDCPAVSGVYKLVENEEEGELVAKIKLSEGKKTIPGRKQVYRVTDSEGNFVRDVIALDDEVAEGEAMLVPIFRNGELVYDLPTLDEIRGRVIANVAKLRPEYRRMRDPAKYEVAVTRKLSELSDELTQKYEKTKLEAA